MLKLTNTYPFGYCTNVHAGIELADAKANLARIACGVRDLVIPNGRLPVGLWLAERAAQELQEDTAVKDFSDWLSDHRLVPYTFNGFPQGDFHQPVVKHAVYEPNWLTQERCAYTLSLANVLIKLLPPGSVGSISTLPLGWPHRVWLRDDYELAAQNLMSIAMSFDRLAQQHGTEIVLAIEPEPGCVLDTADDLVRFFENHLFKGKDAQLARRYLTVCHDVCHSAVMFEPQQEALNSYARSGIRLGKMQVSAAVAAAWPAVESKSASETFASTEVSGALLSTEEQRHAALAQLSHFNEPRYLHQTTRRASQSSISSAPQTAGIELVEDLPFALTTWQQSDDATEKRGDAATGEWRVHFHVPIFVDKFGSLRATRNDISAAVAAIAQHANTTVDGRPWFTGHYEVETYAWGVLPPELQVTNLAQGIARELKYFESVLATSKVANPGG